ncbi:MAG: YhfC family intramembrane metalloprotease [Chloroflexi bacterium]|nr:YhfC family intramembrane metalloprotease [Chloroflexota bacterium]
MTTILLFLNFSLMIVAPIILGGFVAARLKVDWGLFGMGAATFVLSQLFHIPFNVLVLNKWQLISVDTAVLTNLIILALFLGLSAGVFEEVARYLTYRYWATEARFWGQGIMLGVGHGGIEAIILGLLGYYGLMQLLMLQNNPSILATLPVGQLTLVQAQLSQMETWPWYMFLLGAVERGFALCFHIAASLLVLQAFVRHNILWLLAAILLHTAVDTTAVLSIQYLSQRTTTINSALGTEAFIAVYALISLGIIFWLKTPPLEDDVLDPLPEIGSVQPMDVTLSAEQLEKSKYR